MGYEWGGRGVVPPALAIELVTGAATHVGVGDLLLGESLENAVVHARIAFDRELEGRRLGGEMDEALAYARLEQLTLVEMLVRLYHARQLPTLLEEYAVLSVEREIVLPLTPELGWMARADAILRRRADGDLYVYSLKTCNEFSERKDEENRLDMQGISELAAVEHLMGERVQGVKMEFLVKGKRDRYTEWKQDSPLVRPWRKQEQFGVQWSRQNRVPCANPAECKYHRNRHSDNPYHELKEGWDRVPVWEYMTPREWFDQLASGQIAPEGDAFEGLIVTPVPYYRNQEDVGRWRRQVTAQETCVAEDARAVCAAVASGDPVRAEAVADECFPQFKRSCVWPSKCAYYEAPGGCLGTGVTLMDPLGNGMQWRKEHHQPEIDARGEG